jgi:hypothetical protein
VIYQPITPARDVQKIIDLSRLGEFETCKALGSLLEAQIVALVPERKGSSPSAETTVGGISGGRSLRLVPLITRVVVSLGLIVGAAVGVRSLGAAPQRWLGLRQAWGYLDLSNKSEVADAYLQRIERALAVYRAMKDGYPQKLEELVRLGLVTARDLSFPWEMRYHYAARDGGYELFASALLNDHNEQIERAPARHTPCRRRRRARRIAEAAG